MPRPYSEAAIWGGSVGTAEWGGGGGTKGGLARPRAWWYLAAAAAAKSVVVEVVWVIEAVLAILAACA